MRGKKAKVRKLSRDRRYGSALVTKFINKIMLHGKKSVAEKMFYSALEGAAKQTKLDPVEFLNQTVDKVRPALEVKSRRVGGANYTVPMPVSPSRQESLVIRWVVDSARKKEGESYSTLLQKILLETFEGAGDIIKKKEDMERMAEANKAFAHFRW